RRRFALGYHSSRFQRSNAREKMFCGSAVRMTAGTELSIGDRLPKSRTKKKRLYCIDRKRLLYFA
ncbi:MAG: hypothetical protein ACOX9E_15795, partial [Lentisphaeria bacterium]